MTFIHLKCLKAKLRTESIDYWQSSRNDYTHFSNGVVKTERTVIDTQIKQVGEIPTKCPVTRELFSLYNIYIYLLIYTSEGFNNGR